MILINNISDRYFELNGLRFAKIYQPLAKGTENIGLYNINDTRQQLQSGARFDEYQIDGQTFANQKLTIDALLEVVFRFPDAAGAPTSTVWGGVTGDITNQADLMNLIKGKPTENDYLNIAEMLSLQDEQSNGFYQFVKDARRAQEIIDGLMPYSAYYEFLGLQTASLSDYRLVTAEEAEVIKEEEFRSYYYVRQVAQTIPSIVVNGSLRVRTDASGFIVSILFDELSTPLISREKKSCDEGDSLYMKIDNISESGRAIFRVSSIDFSDIGKTNYLVNVVATEAAAIFNINDKVEVSFWADNLGEDVDLSAYQLESKKGTAGGYAGLDALALLPIENHNIEGAISAAALQAAPLDANIFGFLNAAGVLVRSNFGNLKDFFRSYFDTVYRPLKDKVISTNVSGSYVVDLKAATDFHLKMIAATEFTFSNLPTGDEIKRIKIRLSGNFERTFPTWLLEFGDDYDGLKVNDLITEIWSASGESKGLRIQQQRELI